MKIKKRINTFLLILGFFTIQFAHAEIDTNRQKEINYYTNKFRYMLEIAEQYYFDSLRLESVTDESFKRMMNSLDIQSIYYPKLDFQKLQDANKGDAEGIGIDVAPLSDTLTIIKVIEDSPADSAGLLQGDKILFIDGKSTIGFTKNGGDSLIRGDQGSFVHFIIKRQYGSSLLHEYSVHRSEYNLPSITASFLMDDNKTGYIQLSRFSSKTDTEMVNTLSLLKKQGMKDLIIDLRSNLGGVVTATTNSLENFFAKRTELVKIKGRNKSFDSVFYSANDGKYQDIRLLILVDRNSASASEIFSGVMQDYDRGVVIGEKTFGKGTVQKIWKMTDGTGFRITVAEYETPSGRKIQKPSDSSSAISLDPSLELNYSKEEREKILEALKKTGGKSYLPTTFTKNGRLLVANGGITPDIYAKIDTVNLLTRVLTQRGIFLEYVYNFLYSEKDKILQKYKNDYKKFAREYTIEDGFLEEFKKFSFKRNVWNDNYYAQDKEYFRDYLKGLIAYTLWDESGYKFAMLKRDNVINSAIKSLTDYQTILKSGSH
jgi:carboxyl-terminal processing protease